MGSQLKQATIWMCLLAQECQTFTGCSREHINQSQKYIFELGRRIRLPSPNSQFLLLNKQQVLTNVKFDHAVFGHSGVHLFDKDHNMYVIGENYFGQRATGDQKTNQFEMRKIQYMETELQSFNVERPEVKGKQSIEKQKKLNKQKIIDVALGFQHTVIITQNGQLYGCGKADSGQIQPYRYHYYKDVISLDKLLIPDLIWDKRRVIRAACGYKHTIFQTQQGKLYGLGLNKFGQCGVDFTKFEQLKKPTQIYFPAQDGQIILDIKCGSNHTLILTNKYVYFMGVVIKNQNPFILFNENVSAPSIMNLPAKPIKIFTNFDRSAIITEDGKAYIFGGKNLEHRGGQSGKLQVIQDFNFNQKSLIGLGFSHTIIYP